MTRPFEITAMFRHSGKLDVETLLGELFRLTPAMQACSPLLGSWLLKGKSKEDALRYPVFDSKGATPAALAVLSEALKDDVDPRIISIWNGHTGDEGASLQYVARPAPEMSMLVLRAKAKAFASDWKAASELVKAVVSIWPLAVLDIGTSGYSDNKVFKNRPGVGWMLYLPKILSTQQVPEARALLPMMVKDEKNKDRQIGTIVVSITDEAFSDDNPEHVKIANSIEVRLVDQDLLPRYIDL